MRQPQELALREKTFDIIRGVNRNVQFLDFMCNADWGFFEQTANGVGAAAVTAVDAATDRGVVGIDTGTADNSYLTWQSYTQFYLTPGETLSFGGRFKLADVANTEFIFGAIVTDTEPYAAIASGGGLYFWKADTAGATDFKKQITTTATALKSTVDTLVNDTYVKWHVIVDVKAEAVANIMVYVDDVLVYAADDVAVPASTVALRLTYGHKTTEAAANTSDVDYLYWDAPRA